MNLKAGFAETLNQFGSHTNLSANECEIYGITWGCDGGCPVFIRGACKLEDIDAMRDTILNTDRFSSYEIEELNKLYPQLKL